MHELRGVWSPYDYRDSIVVRAVLDDIGAADLKSGAVLVDVQIAAAPLVSADSTDEVADLDRTREAAFWLPSVGAYRVALGESHRVGNSLVLDLTVVRPAEIGERLRASSPGFEAVRMRVRTYLVAPGAAADPGPRWAERMIDIDLVE